MKLSSQTQKIIRRVIIGLLLFAATVLCLVFAILRRPVMYKIADNYTGWVIVKYNDPSCPSLQHQNVFVVIPISRSGSGCTSSPLQTGWRITLYEYVSRQKAIRLLHQSGWGGGGEIWAGFYMVERHSESFFVGTEQKLNKSWSSRPK
jgi:hypothetical protein